MFPSGLRSPASLAEFQPLYFNFRQNGSFCRMYQKPPCILPPDSAEKRKSGCVSSKPPGPSEAAGQQDATHPSTRSTTRTVDGAAANRRARIKTQGGVTAPAAVRMKAMGGVNAAIEVGKHQLDVALGSNGELFSEPNQARAITRLAKRLAELDCTRVLIEGG